MTTRSPQQLKSTVTAVTTIRPHKNSIVYMNNILELPVLEKEQDMYYELTGDRDSVWREHSSVVEHSTADREVPGSIPGAPSFSSRPAIFEGVWLHFAWQPE